MGINWIEWVGYIASFIVLISLAMRSIIYIRIYNFIGCMGYVFYGYLTGLLPISLTNLAIAIINVYYLYQIFTKKKIFKLVIAELDSSYFHHFLESHQKEIELQTPLENVTGLNTCFYLLHGNVISGILAGNKNKDGLFDIKLDFTTNPYRNFKINDHDYYTHNIKSLKTIAKDVPHANYLKNMGFKKFNDHSQIYSRTL